MQDRWGCCIYLSGGSCREREHRFDRDCKPRETRWHPARPLLYINAESRACAIYVNASGGMLSRSTSTCTVKTWAKVSVTNENNFKYLHPSLLCREEPANFHIYCLRWGGHIPPRPARTYLRVDFIRSCVSRDGGSQQNSSL